MAANQKHKTSGRKSQARPNRDTAAAGSQAGRLADVMGHQISDYVSRGRTQVREMTRDHEGAAVLVALAAGFGVGLLIGAALASAQSRPQTWRDRIAAEGLGRRLLEGVEEMIPDTLTNLMRR
jgi:hypothetical protein